jgi:hypothetical protein
MANLSFNLFFKNQTELTTPKHQVLQDAYNSGHQHYLVFFLETTQTRNKER